MLGGVVTYDELPDQHDCCCFCLLSIIMNRFALRGGRLHNVYAHSVLV